MRELKSASLLLIIVVVIVTYFVAKYLVFPLFNLALGITAGIFSAIAIVLLVMLIYGYMKSLKQRRK